MLDEGWDVCCPLAQRRQADRRDIDAVVQVLPKQALPNQLPQVVVGRGDDPDIGTDRHAAADGRELALLKHAQEPGLRVDRHVADLVEEQRAALRLLEPPHAARGSPGERALLMAEQLALDQLARDRGHVDCDERAASALAEIVQSAGYQLLAGAAFAHDRHREVGSH